MCVISCQPCSDAMRLILVKPTNATRRLDSTGEGFHDGDHERCTSGGPSPPTKSPERTCKQYSDTSLEASFSPPETSLCCVSSPLHERSNGISPPRVSAQISPLKTRNLTLSQLSDQEWLLLCGQVSSIGGDTPASESARSCVSHLNHSDRCGCSCSAHQQSEASSFPQQLKQDIVQDCLSPRRRLSSAPYIQSFSQSTQPPNTYQVLPQQSNQKSPLKTASSHPQDNLLLCRDQDGRKELVQPCNHSKLKENSQATLFNIPLNSIERADRNQTPNQHPQPVTADFNWRELFGKQPLLVQQCQKQDSHCSVSDDPTSKSSGDPSIILNCHHLPYNPLTTTQRKSSTPASDKSMPSFSTSQYSSLDQQDLVAERARQRQRKVDELCLNGIAILSNGSILLDFIINKSF